MSTKVEEPIKDTSFVNPLTGTKGSEAMTDVDASRYEEEAHSLRNVILKHFEGSYDPTRRYIICIQGATSSGKSTFSKNLHKILTDGGIASYLLPLDSFYNVPDNPGEEEDKYDFDNPVSLNWEAIQRVLEAIRDNKDTIPYYIRPKSHKEKVRYEEVPNPKPNVVIIEGIYAFNTVNDLVFNLSEYDPYDTQKEIKEEYIKSNFSMGDFKILKIQMTHCKAKLLSIRTSRDLLLGKPRQAVIDRFYDKIWPDTLRWVYSPIYNGYIKVIHGNFNTKKIRMMINELCFYFLGNEGDFLEILDGNFWDESKVECTGECRKNGIPSIILDDN